MDAKALRAMAVGDAAVIAFSGNDVEVDYDVQTNQFTVRLSALETERARLVVGARYHRHKDLWTMPATRSQAAALSGVFNGRLAATDNARAYVRALFTEPIKGEGELVIDTKDHLFPFQEEGVRTLWHAGSALLGDEMGTGKTIQAIEWMRLKDNKDLHLVVCPNSMKFKWASEIDKWWPEADAIVIDGSAAQRRKQIKGLNDFARSIVAVINYESLRSHTRLHPWGGRALTEKQAEPKELNDYNFRCVVVDEAHKIKDPKAQQTMAVKQMGAQSQHRLAMTGTPLLNDPDDIWSIMNFVAPDEYGARNQFRNRYCTMANAWHGGLQNTGLREETRAEFDSFFLPRFLRRTKEEVLPDLPEKLDIDYRLLKMAPKQAKLYKTLSQDYMALVDEELLIAENPLALSIRLRQAASALPVVENGNVVALDTPSCKLDAIRDIIADSSGEPLVIYAESRKLIELFYRELSEKDGLRTGVITGGVGPAIREKHVEAFQDGQLDLMLGTLGAGAEGLTLTAASTIILAQQAWSYATNAQAIDRVHRIGQTRGVHPIVLVTQGTIDEATALVDREKEGRLQELVRDPAWMKKAAIGEIR